MFLKRKTNKFIENCSDKIERLQEKLSDADAVLIGAGSGLSTAAGFIYDGERFKQHFYDFEAKYNFHDMYTGGFYPYQTSEEMWAYWSRYIYVNRYLEAPIPVYNQLYRIIKDKDYFVLTTNVDHCFQKAGFHKKRLFYTQGDYGLFQCSEPCCQETVDNEAVIYQMMEEQKNMKIPSVIIPRCLHCGKPMTMNLRSDDKFVQDEGWYQAAERYEQFVHHHQNMKIVYFELGVGYNTPGIIKYNFWNQVDQNSKATYVCLNITDTGIPQEIKERSICIQGNSAEIISGMTERLRRDWIS